MEEKQYYRIKDVCDFLGENASTIRYWETEFPELAPSRTLAGRRQYTPKDIETLRVIKYLLRTKGMHISLAKEQLKTNRKNLGKRADAVEELLKVKEELELLLQSLSKRK